MAADAQHDLEVITQMSRQAEIHAHVPEEIEPGEAEASSHDADDDDSAEETLAYDDEHDTDEEPDEAHTHGAHEATDG